MAHTTYPALPKATQTHADYLALALADDFTASHIPACEPARQATASLASLAACLDTLTRQEAYQLKGLMLQLATM
jgi:hypothetical protein